MNTRERYISNGPQSASYKKWADNGGFPEVYTLNLSTAPMTAMNATQAGRLSRVDTEGKTNAALMKALAGLLQDPASSEAEYMAG